jgi:hypothetical protein
MAISLFKALAFGFFPVIPSSYPPGITGKVEERESAQCFELSKASSLRPQPLPYTSGCQDCKLQNSYSLVRTLLDLQTGLNYVYLV